MLRRNWIEIAWGCFALANIAIVYEIGHWETIPFHFVWVSLTLVYGLRKWRLGTTVIAMTMVTLISGGALLHAAVHVGGPGLDELAEVPLMAAMFVAMVFYTERTKSATAAQQRMLERERDFIRDASHEFRTPITIARSYAELLRASVEEKEAAEDADIVIDEINRLSGISERLLMLAASERPDFLHVRPIHAQDLIQDVVRRWKRTVSRSWRVDIASDGWIPGDQSRLELMLDSLIENAVKFTTERDWIEVRTEAAHDSLVIVVADSGIGIPDDQIPRIFDRFARADRDRARETGGTGLGLAIVKAIVEAHAGTVEAESRPGMGALFRVRLPGIQLARPATPAGVDVPEPVAAATTRVLPAG